jgi:hypothetical protein
MNDRFIAPDEVVALLYHSPKEIHVAASSAEFREKNRIEPGDDLSLE